MQETPFYSIEAETQEITTAHTIARLIDAIGFRYRWATEDLTENEFEFRPVESSMNLTELIRHIYDLSVWINTTLSGPKIIVEKPLEFLDLRNGTLEIFFKLSTQLKVATDADFNSENLKSGTNEDSKLYWHMLNGPIADTLTHIGQITS